jgi:hypothetical protein
MTTRARVSIIHKRQTRPLVREGTPQKQGHNCQRVINIWSWVPDWLTVSHNVILTSTIFETYSRLCPISSSFHYSSSLVCELTLTKGSPVLSSERAFHKDKTVTDRARYQDWLTDWVIDWPSVAMWLWLWLDQFSWQFSWVKWTSRMVSEGVQLRDIRETRAWAWEAEESPLLEVVTRERLLKTRQARKRLSGCCWDLRIVEISSGTVITCSSEWCI